MHIRYNSTSKYFEYDTGGGVFAQLDLSGQSSVLQKEYPVGSLYFSTSSSNPSTILGFGTWAAFGAGRTIVGIDAGQTEFDTVEETGGAKTHTLVTGEIPAHTHVQDAHNHGVTDPTHFHGGTATSGAPKDASTGSGYDYITGYSRDTAAASTGISVNNATATNQNAGGGGAHNNLQPYIVVYMWKRTA